MYSGTQVPVKRQLIAEPKLQVERIQTGVRMEKRVLKVLKALAGYHDLTLGDLLEGIVLHVFDGKRPFGAPSLQRIRDLKRFYHLDLNSSASHRLVEMHAKPSRKAGSKSSKRKSRK